MLPDYLILNGLEIINSLRAAAYGANPDECGGFGDACFRCPDLGPWLNGGQPYEGITQDPAPWYDPASPESERVYGIVGLEIVGLANGAYPQQGSDTESPSGASRDIMFRVLVEVGDECAATYVAGWLRQAISWSGCGSGCMGATACMLACCPEVDPDTGDPLEQPLRTMYDLTAVEGPEEVERGYNDERIYLIYEFTLRTNNVDIFKAAPLERTIMVSPANGTFTTLDLQAVYENCDPPSECLTDPENPAPQPPTRPSAPTDPRYPTAPFLARRTTLAIPGEWLSRTMLDVAVITIRSDGLAPIRNLLLRFAHNPFGVTCTQLASVNPCRTCTDILIPYVPPNGTVVIDGRTRTKTVTCRQDGLDSSSEAVAFGPLGQMFFYPEFACGPELCVQVYAADPVPAGAQVTIELFQRAGAA
jgi:hypothetical protein